MKITFVHALTHSGQQESSQGPVLRSEMVQRFSLTSLDAREVRLDTASPGEWLFDGSIRKLVDFLTVPVFPSHLYNNKTFEDASLPG